MMLEMCDLDKWLYVESDMSHYNKEKHIRPTRLILEIS